MPDTVCNVMGIVTVFDLGFQIWIGIEIVHFFVGDWFSISGGPNATAKDRENLQQATQTHVSLQHVVLRLEFLMQTALRVSFVFLMFA